MNDEHRPHYGQNGFLVALTIVGVLAIGFALYFRAVIAPENSNQIGKPFPNLEADGWINGEKPSAEDLRGQVLVVDAWAYWCEPCRAAVPELIALHDRFKDSNVKFIGLTSEGRDARALQLTRKYVDMLKVPWVNGYGAVKVLSELDVDTIPQLWVVDRQNRIVFHESGWSQHSAYDLEEALKKALQSQ